MATSLVYKNKVDASKVVILSPYREQRSKISESLKTVYRCKDIPVTTIVKSQGKIHLFVVSSYFVITSTRNCNITDIITNASTWLENQSMQHVTYTMYAAVSSLYWVFLRFTLCCFRWYYYCCCCCDCFMFLLLFLSLLLLLLLFMRLYLLLTL